jgi:hypothetical protein
MKATRPKGTEVDVAQNMDVDVVAPAAMTPEFLAKVVEELAQLTRRVTELQLEGSKAQDARSPEDSTPDFDEDDVLAPSHRSRKAVAHTDTENKTAVCPWFPYMGSYLI